MDVERCIALHNEILLYAWINAGRSPESFESECTTWLDVFSDEAEATRAAFIPDVVRFLEGARMSDPNDMSFFYWVNGLAGPEYMLEFDIEGADDEGWTERYIVLYMMNSFVSHGCGVV
jgi:hypothetical protein